MQALLLHCLLAVCCAAPATAAAMRSKGGRRYWTALAVFGAAASLCIDPLASGLYRTDDLVIAHAMCGP